MIIKTQKEISENEVTDPWIFQNRRTLIKALMATAAGTVIAQPAFADQKKGAWSDLPNSEFSKTDLTPTPDELVKNYTNYYEFSFNKEDSTSLAQKLVTDPWSLEIGGEVEHPGVYHLEELLAKQTLKQYIYRLRCVEAWSMVIPWIGFSLADLLKTAKPLSAAKFVKFTAVYQPETMPNQRKQAMLEWPYIEGLRIDEAMHPLTILAVGMYGEVMPKQNGAPLRLVVPWKYGFKSIKAIVKIELLKRPPITTWNQSAPHEYGFYANVNPKVAHPRWSQASERVLGSGFFTSRRQTELFNGYGEQVASLYSDMDLEHFF